MDEGSVAGLPEQAQPTWPPDAMELLVLAQARMLAQPHPQISVHHHDARRRSVDPRPPIHPSDP